MRYQDADVSLAATVQARVRSKVGQLTKVWQRTVLLSDMPDFSTSHQPADRRSFSTSMHAGQIPAWEAQLASMSLRFSRCCSRLCSRSTALLSR